MSSGQAFPTTITADPGSWRGLTRVVAALFAIEAALYTAVIPLLPVYRDELHLSSVQSGVLTATYPAGLIAGVLLAVRVSGRAGARTATVGGTLVLAAAAAAFGLAGDILALDGLRALQGVAAGCLWGGGLSWLVLSGPRERRGELLGSSFGSALVGGLLGPLVGTLAVTASDDLAFALVGVGCLALALAARRLPAVGRTEPGARLRPSRRLLAAAWPVLLAGLALGALAPLLALRLSQLGAGHLAVGLTFMLAAAVAAAAAVVAGRGADRLGPGRVLATGLASSTVLLVLIPLPTAAPALAALVVVALASVMAGVAIPAGTRLTAIAEHAGAPAPVSSGLLLVALALGEAVGSPVATALAGATAFWVPLALLAGAAAATLAGLRWSADPPPHSPTSSRASVPNW